MYPVLFTLPLPWLGRVPIRAYGFMVMIGCLAAAFVALRRAKKERVEANHIWDMWMWALIAGFAGARILYVILFYDEFRGDLLKVFAIWQGGLAFQGGFVGAVVALCVYLHVKHLSIAKYLDMVVAAVILGYGFARVGCFLNGCCHGRVTDVPWAVTYPAEAPIDAKGTTRFAPAYHVQVAGSPRAMPAWLNDCPGCKNRIADGRLKRADYLEYHRRLESGETAVMPRSCPVHPAQLYASGAAVLIFILLNLYYRLPHHLGQVTALFGVLYAVYRFTNEFFRGDSPTPYLGMTLFQVICIGIFVVFGAGWLVCGRKLPLYAPPATTVE